MMVATWCGHGNNADSLTCCRAQCPASRSCWTALGWTRSRRTPPAPIAACSRSKSERENAPSIRRSQPSVFAICIVLGGRALITGDALPPPCMGIVWNKYLYCRLSFFWSSAIEPNEAIVEKKIGMLIYNKHGFHRAPGFQSFFFFHSKSNNSRVFWMQMLT